MTIEIKKDVTEITVDMLCTALEGGSNYWALMADIIPPDETGCQDYTIPVKDPTFVMDVLDDEDPDEVLGQLTQANLERGWELFAAFTPTRHFENAISGDWDAETADVYFQLAILGDVMYG